MQYGRSLRQIHELWETSDQSLGVTSSLTKTFFGGAGARGIGVCTWPQAVQSFWFHGQGVQAFSLCLSYPSCWKAKMEGGYRPLPSFSRGPLVVLYKAVRVVWFSVSQDFEHDGTLVGI